MLQQLVDGTWDENILKFIDSNDFKTIQSKPIFKRKLTKFEYNETVWYTLIGLALLIYTFPEDAPKYQLIVNKARQTLVNKLGFIANIDETLRELKPLLNYKPYDAKDNDNNDVDSE